MENKRNLKVGAISLGCDKNRVDTENMLFYNGKSHKIGRTEFIIPGDKGSRRYRHQHLRIYRKRAEREHRHHFGNGGA